MITDYAFSSTRVSHGWYDPEHSELTVEFVDGTRWVYRDVPAVIWEAFMNAASPGRFVNDELNQYTNGPG